MIKIGGYLSDFEFDNDILEIILKVWCIGDRKLISWILLKLKILVLLKICLKNEKIRYRLEEKFCKIFIWWRI